MLTSSLPLCWARIALPRLRRARGAPAAPPARRFWREGATAMSGPPSTCPVAAARVGQEPGGAKRGCSGAEASGSRPRQQLPGPLGERRPAPLPAPPQPRGGAGGGGARQEAAVGAGQGRAGLGWDGAAPPPLGTPLRAPRCSTGP